MTRWFVTKFDWMSSVNFCTDIIQDKRSVTNDIKRSIGYSFVATRESEPFKFNMYYTYYTYYSVAAIHGNYKSTRCLQPSSRQGQEQGKEGWGTTQRRDYHKWRSTGLHDASTSPTARSYSDASYYARHVAVARDSWFDCSGLSQSFTS